MKKIPIFILIFLLIPFYSFAQVGTVVSKVSTNEKIIALTFDDWGELNDVKEMLTALEDYDAHSTFFLVGRGIQSNPSIALEIYNRGHEVANHSYSHPKLTSLSIAGIQNQILSTKSAFEKNSGVKMSPYVRPPYGARNAKVDQAILNSGFSNVVMWTIDTNDWRKRSKEQIINEVVTKAAPGKIALMHILPHLHTKEALPEIMEQLYSKGYKVVTITDLINNNFTPTNTVNYIEFLNNLLGNTSEGFSNNYEDIKAKAKKLGITLDKDILKYPNKKVKKQEAYRIFAQISKMPESDEVIYFKDVPTDYKFLPLLRACYSNKILPVEKFDPKGIEFGFNKKISKEEMNQISNLIKQHKQ